MVWERYAHHAEQGHRLQGPVGLCLSLGFCVILPGPEFAVLSETLRERLPMASNLSGLAGCDEHCQTPMDRCVCFPEGLSCEQWKQWKPLVVGKGLDPSPDAVKS